MIEYKTIRELCSIVVDCPHSTPKWTEDGKIVVRNNNIKNGRINLTAPSFTDDEHFRQRIKRAKPQSGDLIITREAPIGEVGMIPANIECCLGQRMVLLRVDQSICDNFYLLYSLQSPYVKNQISWSEGTGTTVSNLRIPHLENIKIPYIPLELQKRVSSVLRVIEEKIFNNSKINENLEQQAQAYFEDLFVVNADPNWPECTLSDIGSIVAGGTPSKSKPEYYADQGIAWITPKDLSIDKSKFISHGENDISELGFSKSSTKKMPAGTVLFSSRAPIGYIAIAQNELTTNQGFKSVIPNEKIGTSYVYFLLKNLLPTIEGMASGSTFKEISGAGMKSVPTVMPDVDTIQFFNNFCEPIFKEQEILEAENRRLSALRDSLLPKLMSGEIDISSLDI